MSYVFIELKIRNGEYEYNSQSVHELQKRKRLSTFAEQQAKTFYGDGKDAGDEMFNDGSYYFNCGEVAVTVYNYKRISKEHYDILKQYL